MTVVRIANIAEARTAGAKYGVEFPAKQGRPPMLKLAKAIVAKGDSIDGTEYFPATWADKTVVTTKPATDTKYTIKATVLTDKGRKRPAKVTMTLAEIREHGDALGRKGRVSESTVIAAAAKYKNWGDVDTLTNVSVIKVADVVDVDDTVAVAA